LEDVSASGGLGLATATAGVQAGTMAAGGSAFITGISLGTPPTPGGDLSELATGAYVAKVDYGTDGTKTKVTLYSASDTAFANPLKVNADGVAGDTATDRAVTVDTSSAAKTIDFGNGLKMSLTKFATAADKGTSGVISYTAAGSTTLSLTSVTAGKTIDQTSSATDFANYMNDIQSQLDTVSGQLSMVGALEGRLSYKEDQVSNAQINIQGAYNRIMNANMADEQVQSSKYQILQQTSAAMLAQANAAPQFLLSLFK
jgi:flagellin-like hook-associated protein FlgL